jgi:phage tail tape-measure protein
MRRLVAWVLLIGFGVAGSGCATASQPTVYAYPTKGQTAEQQSRDRTECEAWAKQQTGFDPAKDTAKGAGVGALVGAAGGAAAGAAIGAAAGSPGKGALIGAAAGGLGGAAVGGGLGYTKNKEGFDKAYAACMSARGYEVR